MQAEKKERWMRLCEQASTEQDSQKLVALAQEIVRLLEEKQTRLAHAVTDRQNPSFQPLTGRRKAAADIRRGLRRR